MFTSQRTGQRPGRVLYDQNDNYGVYALRADYAGTMLRSLAILWSGIGLMFYIVMQIMNSEVRVQIMPAIPADSTYTVKVFLPEPSLPPAGQPDAPEKRIVPITGNEYRNVTISDSVAVDSHSIAATGTDSAVTRVALNTGSGTASFTGNERNTGTSTVAIRSDIVHPYEVDELPEFEGGFKALYQFIAKNINYPPPARENFVEGTVHLRFVVEKDGSVKEVLLLNKLGYGLDEEALRVVGMIPAFKSPAKSKGRAVKMYYNLPLKYKLK